MSNKEVIIRLLVAVQRRMRGNRILSDSTAGLSIALLVPVGFKVVDLLSPFRGTTVIAVFIIWALLTAAWLIWRARGTDALDRTAAQIDQRTGALDEIKTAYWFIRNPKDSHWVEAQIERAAKSANRLQVDTLYPRMIPRASYSALGLMFLLGILNFLPLPWNNNWLLLHGAPAFSLTSDQKTMLEQALELLKKAEELQQTDLAEKLAAIIRALQDGSMSKDEFSRSLSELQRSLSERNLDAGRINDGLEKIAKALEPSALTRPVAVELFGLDLKGAAAEVRNISKNLDRAGESALREMSERFQESADVAGKGLEQLSQYLRDTANTMRQRDIPGGQKALEQVAREFERLQRMLDSQRLRSEAGEQISQLQESVGGNPGEVGEGEEVAAQAGEGEGEGEGEGSGEGKGSGKGQGEGEGQGQGEGEGEGQGDGEGEGEGDGKGDGGGRGGDQAGLSGPFPARGEPTSLETQLDREVLPVRPTKGSRPETIQENSQRERSKLDYRNVPSQLTPAQKDLLNQDAIPWEQRRFVKEYFETIRK